MTAFHRSLADWPLLSRRWHRTLGDIEPLEEMTMIERLARAMFQRRCDLDGAEPALVEMAWADADVRRFWVAEAEHVLQVLNDPSAELLDEAS